MRSRTTGLASPIRLALPCVSRLTYRRPTPGHGPAIAGRMVAGANLEREPIMTFLQKTRATALAAVALSGAALAAAAPAEAGWGRRQGGAVAVGVIGGLALGAAIASQQPAYAYEPVYESYRPICTVTSEEGYDTYGRYFKRRVKTCR